MTKEYYVSFEIAQLLREKGFNERCRCYYTNGRINRRALTVTYKTYDSEDMRDCIICPTVQMTCAWLRYKGWHIMIEPYFNPTDSWGSNFTFDGWDVSIIDIKTGLTVWSGSSELYENAMEDAIKYCLTDLIKE